MTLAEINAQLDEALDDRVRAHRQRAAGDIGVPEYLARLKAVRELEDELEPLRRAAGGQDSRAFERCVERGEIEPDPERDGCWRKTA